MGKATERKASVRCQSEKEKVLKNVIQNRKKKRDLGGSKVYGSSGKNPKFEKFKLGLGGLSTGINPGTPIRYSNAS